MMLFRVDKLLELSFKLFFRELIHAEKYIALERLMRSQKPNIVTRIVRYSFENIHTLYSGLSVNIRQLISLAKSLIFTEPWFFW